MEMAGIVTYTGALLIKQARELVEQVRCGILASIAKAKQGFALE